MEAFGGDCEKVTVVSGGGAAAGSGEQWGAPAAEEAGRRGKLGRGAGWDRGGSRPAPFGERGGAGEAQDPGRRLCRGFHL